jgi:hypothetical protein
MSGLLAGITLELNFWIGLPTIIASFGLFTIGVICD